MFAGDNYPAGAKAETPENIGVKGWSPVFKTDGEPPVLVGGLQKSNKRKN